MAVGNQTPEDLSHRAATEYAREQAARRLHAQTTTVLGYCNIPLRPTEGGFDPSPILGDDSLCATNLDRLLLGGVKVIVWSPGIPFWTPSGDGLAGRAKVRFIQQQLAAVHRLTALTDGRLRVAGDAQEIRDINAAGGVAVLLHLSGVNHLNDLGVLRDYYDLGVRMIHCAFQDWPDAEPLADTVRYEAPYAQLYHGRELNAHGVRTIEEMKRLGIILDTAHLLPQGFDDITPRLEGLPFVYSHGACGALSVSDRNFTDARIAVLAEHGGVYGIGPCLGPSSADESSVGDLANRRKHEQIAARRAEREHGLAAQARDVHEYIRFRYRDWAHWEERELAALGGYVVKPSLWHVVAHMAHLRCRFGASVVGYGPDYEYTYQYVTGLEEADKTAKLTQALSTAGFPPEDVQAAMGHNFMRVFDAIL